MAYAPKWMADTDITAPALHLAAITPHASTNIPTGLTRAIYVGVGGNIAAVTADDVVVNLLGATTGSVLPIRVKRINAVNTTATDLVALY